jgi:hypothetical protein
MLSSGFLVLGGFKKGCAFLRQVVVGRLKGLCVRSGPPAVLFFPPPASKVDNALMKRGIPFQEKTFSTVCPNLAVQRFEQGWEDWRKTISLPPDNKQG